MFLKNLVTTVTCCLLAISGLVHADGHGTSEQPNVVNVQINLCNLNDGYSMKDYDKMNREYFEWAKENKVEVTFIRQNPIFTHSSPNNPYQWEFSDLLVSDYETSGKAWDKWLGTKSGQKLNEKWQEIASCDVKFMAFYLMHFDPEVMNSDEDRVVAWDYCVPLDGTTPEKANAYHAEVLKKYEGEFISSAWAIGVPSVGLGQVEGFFHINAYKDFETYQSGRKMLHAEGGWETYFDYQSKIANCTGDSVFQESTMNRPTE